EHESLIMSPLLANVSWCSRVGHSRPEQLGNVWSNGPSRGVRAPSKSRTVVVPSAHLEIAGWLLWISINFLGA
ncbi:hypothetical protein ACFFNA_22715, partial [Mesorhizobium kowhaii]|uniref:hypothetical protein n=1 Tax=Mesorhizobium kowhaii TaxID=1300272 RepID=UPI0035F067D4